MDIITFVKELQDKVKAEKLVGYKKVEQMLHEMEEIYRKQGLEHIRSLMEEQK